MINIRWQSTPINECRHSNWPVRAKAQCHIVVTAALGGTFIYLKSHPSEHGQTVKGLLQCSTHDSQSKDALLHILRTLDGTRFWITPKHDSRAQSAQSA